MIAPQPTRKQRLEAEVISKWRSLRALINRDSQVDYAEGKTSYAYIKARIEYDLSVADLVEYLEEAEDDRL